MADEREPLIVIAFLVFAGALVALMMWMCG